MKLWARLDANPGTVQEIVALDDDAEPGVTIFHSDLVFVAASDEAKVGYTFADGAFTAPPPPTLAALSQALVARASAVCIFVTSQVVPDPTHQNAYLSAAAMVGPSATVPSVDPIKTAFAALAGQFGMQPQGFATLAVAVAATSMTLSSILAALQVAAGAAKSPADLAAALATFEAAIGALIATLNGSGLVITVVAPTAVAIEGINA